MLAVAVYTFQKKDFSGIHAPLHVGSGIGLYDGFFGLGTGSFLAFLFVRFFGFDFLGASALAKVVNVACNLSALMWFGYVGHLLWFSDWYLIGAEEWDGFRPQTVPAGC